MCWQAVFMQQHSGKMSPRHTYKLCCLKCDVVAIGPLVLHSSLALSLQTSLQRTLSLASWRCATLQACRRQPQTPCHSPRQQLRKTQREPACQGRSQRIKAVPVLLGAAPLQQLQGPRPGQAGTPACHQAWTSCEPSPAALHRAGQQHILQMCRPSWTMQRQCMASSTQMQRSRVHPSNRTSR